MPDTRPNILFLMTDEQRFDCLGSENRVVRTPHLDALAKDGIRFTRAYTTSPSCVPARAAIFTGKYPSQCSCPTYITHLPASEVTFMSRLRDAGYYTAGIGKQHFGDTDIPHGYDYENIVDNHFPPVAGDMKNENAYTAFTNASGLSAFSERQNRFCFRWTAPIEYYVDEYVGERGKEWIRDHAPADRPWYCHISFPGPHMPYDGLGLPDEREYDGADIDLPVTSRDDLKQKPNHYLEQLRTGSGNPGMMPVDNITEDELRLTRRAYYSNMTCIDRKIGEIIEELKKCSLYDNTLIVFCSDHGDFMGDFGMMGKGQYLAEVLMRIPFIIKPPAAHDLNRQEASLVSAVDLPCTFMAAAGLPPNPDLHGKDLSGYWTEGDGDASRNTVYCDAQGLRSIRDRTHKLVHYADRSYGELYNLVEDPWERVNLWDDSGHQEVKLELTRRLLDEMIRVQPRSHERWAGNSPNI